MGYEEFLASKAWAVPTVSVDPAVAINPALFGFQHDVVRWALRKGRAAIFADCAPRCTPTTSRRSTERRCRLRLWRIGWRHRRPTRLRRSRGAVQVRDLYPDRSPQTITLNLWGRRAVWRDGSIPSGGAIKSY